MRVFSLSRQFCGAALIAATLVGCGSKAGPGGAAAPNDQKHHEKDGHNHGPGEHSQTGPHGGHLIELGQEAYHAELIHDENTHQVTVYILDGRAKENVPIAQSELIMNMMVAGSPKQFKLGAAPLPDDSENMASRFQTENEQLCESLCESGVKGRLNVNIGGKQFVGEIEQHDHEGHEHTHQALREDHQHQ